MDIFVDCLQAVRTFKFIDLIHKNDQSIILLQWQEHLSRGKSLNFSQDFGTYHLCAFKDIVSLFWAMFTYKKN